MGDFAARDIITIAQIERDATVAKIQQLNKYGSREGKDICSLIAMDAALFAIDVNMQPKAEKAMHSFFSDLYTMVENVYLMAGAHYGLLKDGRAARAQIAGRLKSTNAGLEQYLKENLFEAPIMKETQELRHTDQHEIPQSAIEVVRNKNPNQNEGEMAYRLELQIRTKDISRDTLLFDYMVFAYRHVVEHTAEVVRRLVGNE